RRLDPARDRPARSLPGLFDQHGPAPSGTGYPRPNAGPADQPFGVAAPCESDTVALGRPPRRLLGIRHFRDLAWYIVRALRFRHRLWIWQGLRRLGLRPQDAERRRL